MDNTAIMEALPWAKILIFGFVCIVAAIGLIATLISLIVKLCRHKQVKKTVIMLVIFGIIFGVTLFVNVRTFWDSVMIMSQLQGDQARTEFAENFSGSTDSITFTTTDRDGNTVDTSVFKDYKVTLINFWEPWCGPCKAEIPDLQRLYEKYHDQGFNVIGIYETEEDAENVIKELGMTYTILHNCEGFDFLKIPMSIPVSVFVDSEGKMLTIPEEYTNHALTGEYGVNNSLKEVFDAHAVQFRDGDQWEALVSGFLAEAK